MQTSAGHAIRQGGGLSGFPASTAVPPSTGTQVMPQLQGSEIIWYPTGQGGGRSGSTTQGGGGSGQIRPSGLPSLAIPASTGAQMGQPQGSVLGMYPLKQGRSIGQSSSSQYVGQSGPPESFAIPASGGGTQ